MALSITLKSTAALCIITGSMDIFLGPNFLFDSIGAPRWTPNAIMGNQYRFFGGIWAGYGAMLWWVSGDIRTRQTPLAILMAAMVYGGIGRVAAAASDGFGATLMKIFTGIEFVVPFVIGGLARAVAEEGPTLV